MSHAYVMSLLNRDIPQVARISSHVNNVHYVGYHIGVLTRTLCKILQYPEYLDRYLLRENAFIYFVFVGTESSIVQDLWLFAFVFQR